jgi:hypothetical protein
MIAYYFVLLLLACLFLSCLYSPPFGAFLQEFKRLGIAMWRAINTVPDLHNCAFRTEMRADLLLNVLGEAVCPPPNFST